MDGSITCIMKKIGPGVSNITTTEFAATSKLDDDVNFYRTANPYVAKKFNLEADVKRPAIVLLKKAAEKVTHFDGQFGKSVIANFVSANKLALVITFTRESAPLIFESPIKKQISYAIVFQDTICVLTLTPSLFSRLRATVLLFASPNNSQDALQAFQEAANLFK